MGKYILVSGIILTFFSFVLNSYGETAGIDDLALKQCMDNFTIDEIDFKDSKNSAESYLLNDYFICRAVVNDDIAECNSLLSPGECQRPVKGYLSPHIKAMRIGMITPSILKESVDNAVGVGKDIESHRILLRAILENDPSLCGDKDDKGANKCRALASKDVKSCPDQNCKESVYFMQAIKDNNVEICQKLSKGDVVWVCRSAVTQDLKTCEQSEGYKKFKQTYCENILKSKEGEDDKK